jgi:predicted DNA-binding transcriptional regulator AlpA
VINSPQLQLARLALSALPPGERAALLAEQTTERPERILSRQEVARRFNRTPRSVDHWARKGLFEKVRLPGSSRAVGFRESDVERLIAGRPANDAA